MNDNYKDNNEDKATPAKPAEVSPDDAKLNTVADNEPTVAEVENGASRDDSAEEGTALQGEAKARWDYIGREDENIKIELPKRKKSRGGIGFAIIMVCVFTIALTALFVFTLIEGPSIPDDDGYELNIEQATGVLPEGSFATSETLEQTKDSVVLINCTRSTGTGTGSGFILDKNGFIATNQHVVDDASSIIVTLYNGEEYEATVIGESERDDIALIKINADGLHPATLACSKNLKLGETVYAIGAPGGNEFAWSVTRGSVSHVLRNINIYSDTGVIEKRMNVIQTDTAVNHGNSGGPLVNAAGQVVGIVTLKLDDDYDGMGFAIPIDGAVKILEELEKNGKVDGSNTSVSSPQPVIGITGATVEGGKWYSYDSIKNGTQIIPVDESIVNKNPSAYLYAEVSGALVLAFSEGQDAANKLQVYDIITKVDGNEIRSVQDVINIIGKKLPGDEVELIVRRNGIDVKATITLGAS